MAHRIELTEEARRHLRGLSVGDQREVLAAVRARLLHEPTRETRNRKRLRANPLAPWALRVGHLRVDYGVSERDESIVTVRAIGVKVRERVLIGGEEIDLS